jgi:hypothetical protein
VDSVTRLDKISTWATLGYFLPNFSNTQAIQHKVCLRFQKWFDVNVLGFQINFDEYILAFWPLFPKMGKILFNFLVTLSVNEL